MPINSYRRSKSESGQVLLVVVLVAVISLTVGLAAISRSITNTRVSTEESNSQKALSAAEAGLEEQLKRAKDNTALLDQDINGDLTGDSKYTAKVKTVQGRDVVINSNQVKVSRTEGADVWLSTYPDFSNPLDRRIRVYWIDDETGNCANKNAAIEIIVLKGVDKTAAAKNNPILERYAYDGCGGRRDSNNFQPPAAGTPPYTLTYNNVSYDFNRRSEEIVINNGYILRIIPLYNDTYIGVRSVNAAELLPAQGFDIESTGTSGEAQRKVKVFQSFPTVPIEIFPYNLFNP